VADGADDKVESHLEPHQQQQLPSQSNQQEQQQQQPDDQPGFAPSDDQSWQATQETASESDYDPSQHARSHWEILQAHMHTISAGQRMPALLPVLRMQALLMQQLLRERLQDLCTPLHQQELLCLWQDAHESGWLPPAVHQVLRSCLDPQNTLQWAADAGEQLQLQPLPGVGPEAAPLLALALLALFAPVYSGLLCAHDVLQLQPLTSRLGAPWAEHSTPRPDPSGCAASAAPGAGSDWDVSALTLDVVGRVAQLLQVQLAGWLAGTPSFDLWVLLEAFEFLFRTVHWVDSEVVARREVLLQVMDVLCSAQFVAASIHVQGSADDAAGAMGPGQSAAEGFTLEQCKPVWCDLLQAAASSAARGQYRQEWSDFLQPTQPAATAEQAGQPAAPDAAAACTAEFGCSLQQQQQALNSSSSSGPQLMQLGPHHLPHIIAAAAPSCDSGVHLCLVVTQQLLDAAVQTELVPLPCLVGPDWPPSGRHLATAWASVLAVVLKGHPQLAGLHPLPQFCLQVMSFAEAAYSLHPAALDSNQVWAALCISRDELEHSCHILRALRASVTWCAALLEPHRHMPHPVCAGGCACQALAGALAGELLLLWHQEAQLVALADRPEAHLTEEQRATEPAAAARIRSAAAADLPGVLKAMLRELLSSACRAQQQQQQQQQLPADTSAGQLTEAMVSCGRKLVATWQAVYRLLLLPGAELVQAHAAVCLGGQGLRAFMYRDTKTFEGNVREGQYAAAGNELDRLLGHLQRRPSPAALDVDFSVPATQA
jgi:hypothetical protein